MIKVYSKPNCMQCKFTKIKLEELKVPYVEINVEEDELALKELKDAKYSGLPVVAIDNLDNAWVGYRPDRLAELVNK